MKKSEIIKDVIVKMLDDLKSSGLAIDDSSSETGIELCVREYNCDVDRVSQMARSQMLGLIDIVHRENDEIFLGLFNREYKVNRHEDGTIESVELKKDSTHGKALKMQADKINGAEYSATAGSKWIHVCRNNGQFHKGDASHLPGWATYIGRFSLEESECCFFWKS